LSAIRLYLDEDAAQLDLVAALRLRNVDVTRAQEKGLVGVSDEEQLEWCQANARVLYTFNVRHFYALHCEFLRIDKPHAGIILAPQQRYSIGEQMRRLLRLIERRPAEQMANHVEYLSAWD
jgi:hypothetical protein